VCAYPIVPFLCRKQRSEFAEARKDIEEDLHVALGRASNYDVEQINASEADRLECTRVFQRARRARIEFPRNSLQAGSMPTSEKWPQGPGMARTSALLICFASLSLP
jgi:hypothetical protein